jgi:hypothetical protein
VRNQSTGRRRAAPTSLRRRQPNAVARTRTTTPRNSGRCRPRTDRIGRSAHSCCRKLLRHHTHVGGIMEGWSACVEDERVPQSSKTKASVMNGAGAPTSPAGRVVSYRRAGCTSFTGGRYRTHPHRWLELFPERAETIEPARPFLSGLTTGRWSPSHFWSPRGEFETGPSFRWRYCGVVMR